MPRAAWLAIALAFASTGSQCGSDCAESLWLPGTAALATHAPTPADCAAACPGSLAGRPLTGCLDATPVASCSYDGRDALAAFPTADLTRCSTCFQTCLDVGNGAFACYEHSCATEARITTEPDLRLVSPRAASPRDR